MANALFLLNIATEAIDNTCSYVDELISDIMLKKYKKLKAAVTGKFFMRKIFYRFTKTEMHFIMKYKHIDKLKLVICLPKWML